MTASVDLAQLRERVRDSVSMVQVATFDGLVLRMSGREMGTCECPFHAEKTASFVVGGAGWKRGRYHCWGCGEDGDIFDYWKKRRGVDHAEAVKQLAGLAGIYVGEIRFEKPKAGVERSPERRLDDDAAEADKPSLPSLYQARREDCEAIAKGRGLDVEAVWFAARVAKHVAITPQWPMREAYGKWWPKDGWEQHRCWTIIDATRNVAEFRRCDNGLHTKRDGSASPKVWSTKGKSWPVGAADIKGRKRVLLVEGGPDMLAAYHFLKLFHTVRRPLMQDVAVVCMLGASNKMRADALGFFAGCRVRIMVDADVPKDDETMSKRKLTGLEAAKRWTDQLREAGAAVECFYVGNIYEPDDVAAWHEGTIKAADIRIIEPGLVTRDGKPVKDLNNMVECDDQVLDGADLREAMTDWDF